MAFAPAVSWQGAGLNQAGSAQLGQMISDYADRQRTLNANAKAADILFKNNPEVQSMIGVMPEEWQNLGARDKVSAIGGAMQAYTTKMQQAKGAAEIADLESQTNERNAMGAYRSQQAQQDEALGPAIAAYVQTPGSADEKMAAAFGTPGVGGRNAERLFGDIQKYLQVRDTGRELGAPNFSEGPYPGTKIISLPGSRQWQLARDPSQAIQAAVDPDTGEPIPNSLLVNGKLVQQKQAAAPKIPDSFNKTMDQVSGTIADAQAVLNDPSADAAAIARNKRNLAAAQSRGKAIVDRHYTTGIFNEDQRNQFYSELGLQAPAAKGASAPTGNGKKLSADEAKKFLDQAGGDKAKARQLAKEAGYTF